MPSDSHTNTVNFRLICRSTHNAARHLFAYRGAMLKAFCMMINNERLGILSSEIKCKIWNYISTYYEFRKKEKIWVLDGNRARIFKEVLNCQGSSINFGFKRATIFLQSTLLTIRGFFSGITGLHNIDIKFVFDVFTFDSSLWNGRFSTWAFLKVLLF